MSDAAAFAAYNGLRIKLPNGKLLEGKPLDFTVALELLELLTDYQNGGDPRTTLRPMLERFFAETGADKEAVHGITLGEMNDVVRRFFYQRRWSAADMAFLGILPATAGEPPAEPPPAKTTLGPRPLAAPQGPDVPQSP